MFNSSGQYLATAILILSTGSCHTESRDLARIPPDATIPYRNPYAGERLRELQVAARSGDYDLIFLGDSITEGWNKAGSQVWDDFYGHRRALNLGVSMADTGSILWRIHQGHLEGLEPQLIVLMIGTNNTQYGGHTPKNIADGIAKVVAAIREHMESTRILVLSILPRGRTRTDPYRRNNEAVNELLRGLADGDLVWFRDISSAFLTADGAVMTEAFADPVHLSTEGYRLWAEAIEADVALFVDEPDGVAKLKSVTRT